jgi:hypothetical protein
VESSRKNINRSALLESLELNRLVQADGNDIDLKYTVGRSDSQSLKPFGWLTAGFILFVRCWKNQGPTRKALGLDI